MSKQPTEAVVMPLFRRGSELDGVPEVAMVSPPGTTRSTAPTTVRVDLTGKPKVWLLSGPGGAGKTAVARWLIWRMTERGGEALLAALDPANRTLASWFSQVNQPLTNDGAHSARFLRDFLDHLAAAQTSAVIDLGGGDTALERIVNGTMDLHKTFEDAGVGLVACYALTPRVDDLNIIKTMEAAGFQPSATVILLNEGRADPTVPPEEAFAAVTRHSIFRQVVARGAAAVWMPALESDVMQEIEVKRLDFGMARDGQVPEGAAFFPIGGLRRSSVGRWLARMEQAFSPVSSWLP